MPQFHLIKNILISNQMGKVYNKLNVIFHFRCFQLDKRCFFVASRVFLDSLSTPQTANLRRHRARWQEQRFM